MSARPSPVHTSTKYTSPPNGGKYSRRSPARDVVTDTVAFLLFTAIVVAIILSSCAVAWVVS